VIKFPAVAVCLIPIEFSGWDRPGGAVFCKKVSEKSLASQFTTDKR
jgi:hypothetical protein